MPLALPPSPHSRADPFFSDGNDCGTRPGNAYPPQSFVSEVWSEGQNPPGGPPTHSPFSHPELLAMPLADSPIFSDKEPPSAPETGREHVT